MSGYKIPQRILDPAIEKLTATNIFFIVTIRKRYVIFEAKIFARILAISWLQIPLATVFILYLRAKRNAEVRADLNPKLRMAYRCLANLS